MLELQINNRIKSIPLTLNETNELCDIDWIRSKERSTVLKPIKTISVIDLYSGCGGMSLGVREALQKNNLKFDIKLAVDTNLSALEVYRRNFQKQEDIVKNLDINEFVSTKIGEKPNEIELRTQSLFEGTQILVAGPPCQGHSNLNNHTRRNDPRNNLYLNAVRFVELIRPKIAIIENVSTVIHDKDTVVQKAEKALKRAGYTIYSQILNASKYGIAQTRKRHFQVAVLKENIHWDLNDYEEETTELSKYLEDILTEHERNKGIFYSPSITQKVNQRRIDILFEQNLYDLPDEHRPDCHKFKNHSYKSCYGRLYWNRPAQTITSGFGSMGQGRYIHPLQRRVITPHEAARIQGFPDFFKFDFVQKRGDLHTMIANAVPPKLIAIILDSLIKKNAL